MGVCVLLGLAEACIPAGERGTFSYAFRLELRSTKVKTDLTAACHSIERIMDLYILLIRRNFKLCTKC